MRDSSKVSPIDEWGHFAAGPMFGTSRGVRRAESAALVNKNAGMLGSLTRIASPLGGRGSTGMEPHRGHAHFRYGVANSGGVPASSLPPGRAPSPAPWLD